MHFLSDVIDEKEYQKWKQGDLVFIFSGTGSGKTTLALKKLSLEYFEQNKSILYLVPRKILKQQIEDDMKEILNKHPETASEYSQRFNVWTYQQLEDTIIDKHIGTIPPFDLLICDECHYFIADSIFNRNTMLSYNYIFHNDYYFQNEKLILLLTATPNDIMDYIINDIPLETIPIENTGYSITTEELERKYYSISDIFYEPNQAEYENCNYILNSHNVYVYKLPKKYDYLDIKYFINEDEIIKLVKRTKEKSLIFVSNKSKGKKLEEKLLENKISTIYIDSENKDNEKKKNVEKLKETKTFPQKVFITTSVLDVGVDFFDKNIRQVVVAHTEPLELLQMLGRVRIQQTGQKISLFIFQRSATYFQNLLKKNIKVKIDCCEYLKNKKYSKKNIRKKNIIKEKRMFSDYLDKNDEEMYSEYMKENEYIDEYNLDYILHEELKPNNDLPDGYKDFLYLDWNGENLKIKLNELALYRLRQLSDFYKNICNKMMREDKNYFIKKQLECLGRENDFSNKNFYCLACLQENIENKMKKTKDGILGEECKNMLSEFKPLVRTMDKNLLRSNEKLSVKVFNNFCKTYNMDYCIAQKEDNKVKKTRYYLLKSDDDIINQLELTIQL